MVLKCGPAGFSNDRTIIPLAAASEVDGQPFQPAHIEIVDKLYNSHGGL
jgi:hypothetical protein